MAVILLEVLMNKNAPPTATYAGGVLAVDGERYELAPIPAGTFEMGSDSPEAFSQEQPVHAVRISKEFRMGKTEVPQALWQAVMGSNPSMYKKGGDYPVERVSWNDCQAFIQKLNLMVGGNALRLPTEAEWEYACRGGTAGDRYGDIDAIAWYIGNSVASPHAVGRKQPNAWGLYDMLGNVWEWCADWHDAGYFSVSPAVDPQGPAGGSGRVNRGGSWDEGMEYFRASVRNLATPAFSACYLGFRLASDQ